MGGPGSHDVFLRCGYFLSFTSNLDLLGLPTRGVRNRDFARSLNFSSTSSDCSWSFLAFSSLILFLTSILVAFFFLNKSPDLGLPESLHSFQADLLSLQSCFSCSSLKKLRWCCFFLLYFQFGKETIG